MGRERDEKYLVLQQELKKRRESDPLYLFQPHAKQKAFIEAVLYSDILENWFVAANRAGKSDGGAFCGAKLTREGNPDARYVTAEGSGIAVKDRSTSGWVVTLDFPSARDILQPKYFDNGFVPKDSSHAPFIPDREIKDWRASDQILLLKNGSPQNKIGALTRISESTKGSSINGQSSQ